MEFRAKRVGGTRPHATRGALGERAAGTLMIASRGPKLHAQRFRGSPEKGGRASKKQASKKTGRASNKTGALLFEAFCFFLRLDRLKLHAQRFRDSQRSFTQGSRTWSVLGKRSP